MKLPRQITRTRRYRNNKSAWKAMVNALVNELHKWGFHKSGNDFKADIKDFKGDIKHVAGDFAVNASIVVKASGLMKDAKDKAKRDLPVR